MTALSQIFGAIDERLALLIAQSNGSYERMPSGDPDIFPALHVFDEGDDPAEQEAVATRLDLEISVEGYMEGHGGAATHDAMLALHADTVKAMCGDILFNLDGLVENIEIIGRRRVQVVPLAEKRRLSFAQDFLITFATVRGDPNEFA
ncbi:hypothetical protein M9978_16425 [Sphingomonas sp. MG17]|uniref:Uncharacterized protein n=1 Tax=Sphingomonas tagetis TaxID=2949092 RepID=A0A9X2KMT1_9SPHN|nr:hypothetical protein [Sphingomonas tagetis]MCP3732012.1 hypothetical protein [Sphingomonas tagetis]